MTDLVTVTMSEMRRRGPRFYGVCHTHVPVGEEWWVKEVQGPSEVSHLWLRVCVRSFPCFCGTHWPGSKTASGFTLIVEERERVCVTVSIDQKHLPPTLFLRLRGKKTHPYGRLAGAVSALDAFNV